MVDRIAQKMENLYNRIDWLKIRFVLICSFLWGIVAHGYMMFNRFSWNDDIVCTYQYGATYIMGRWMIDYIGKFFRFLFGYNYSQPLCNGIISLLCLSIASLIILDLFEIKKKSSIVLVTGAMVVSPTITCFFTFMFTSVPCLIGMTFCVCGVWIACKKRNIVHFACAVILICCSIGVYQTWFPLALTLFVLEVIIDVVKNEKHDWKVFITKGIYYVGICLFSLVLYILINEFFLTVRNLEMDDHAGLNTYGMASLGEYLQRALYAYRMFFRPTRGLYPSFISKVYKLLLLCEVLLVINFGVKTWRVNIARGIQYIIAVALFPLATCFIYVLAGDAYALSLFPYILVYIFFIWLLEKKTESEKISDIWLRRCGLIFVFAMCVWFSCYSNYVYLKAEMVQSRAISYYTTLITRIQSMEGYTEEMEIAFINDNQNKSLKNVTMTEETAGLLFVPNTYLNDYTWKIFMREWCGYEPQEASEETVNELMQLHEVQTMPVYPNDGSIKIVNDVIIVNIGK